MYGVIYSEDEGIKGNQLMEESEDDVDNNVSEHLIRAFS